MEQEEKKLNFRIKALLLIMFLLSLVSIFIMLIILSFSISSSPLPQFPLVMSEYAWKGFYALPIPLLSLILGMIFIRKNYRCKKNIIAGLIMSVIITIYSCFSFTYGNQISHDPKYNEEISTLLKIDIPKDSYLSYTENYSNSKSLTMIKIDESSKDHFINQFDNNENWKKDISFIPANTIDVATLTLTEKYDYFSIFNKTKTQYLDFDGEIIFLAYDIDTSVFFVLGF